MTKKQKAKKSSKSTKSARKSKAPAKRSASSYLSVATSKQRDSEERVAALLESPLSATEKEESLQPVLNVLRNKEEPVPVRLAALQTLQAASFGSIAFESLRSDYIAALRQVAEDPDAELRQRALGILAREKDGFAQKKLLEGLENPEKALLPPEKALQLLSYDVHADAYKLARKIASQPPNTAAKREALRLLAADAKSAPLFEKVLRDKEETPDIRQISAAALHALKPQKMQELAREMVFDTGEQEEMQATSLTALTQFGNLESVGDDEALLKRVAKLREKAKVRQSARQFIKKYKR